MIELLVVIGIIGLLVGLTLPAVQSARESARRLQCANNLKQIGTALHNYHDSHGLLPFGRTNLHDARFLGGRPSCESMFVDRSIWVSLLPFLEQSAVYNAVNNNLSIFAMEQTTAHVFSIESFVCPNDPNAGRVLELSENILFPFAPDPPSGRNRMVFTSYAGCFGSIDAGAQPIGLSAPCSAPPRLVALLDGVFNDVKRISFASIRDGLSTTMFVAERAIAASDVVTFVNPSLARDWGWYVSGTTGGTLFVAFYPPNSYRKVSPAALYRIPMSASSFHPNMIHVLMGDGSVRAIKDTIDTWPFDTATGTPQGATRNSDGSWSNLPPPGIWQKLATRAGAEVIDSEGYGL